MAKLGGYLAVAGVISCVLNLLGYNLRILMWIDLWGPTVGWAIRAGLIIAGVGFFFLGKKEEAPSVGPQSPG